ncbi:protein-L-isoaspartate O-methyltransferase family protein [Amycolatopsis cihanbeyliensis]|uniref:Protein-L-isoaspartate O-methyltransferase n=1 Tax=Amycolatopsis cihanbeyliensis TaxID=1128664 RepID=A0A542DDW5_AMYCI|nr:hypothetical protein [Amycolatopsis cihanbeyliensis]TQJ01267.1 protein-L-isoaspartate(D-aspartate) O-methyltransferase [Amycolatopsis cihanbeyliensis]
MTIGWTSTPELDDRLARYADELRERGAITTDAVRAAFATVPRHAFLRSFYFRADRHALKPGELPPSELLDIIYANNSLVTHDGRTPGQPMSSSSGPSVMARMLEALRLRPGLRVLEIGAGTGYNAALIHAITGAEVTAVEAGDAAATEAAVAIAELGLAEQIRIVHGDGYRGDPERGRWDRIVVTCGIAGIPEGWLTQLAEDGLIVAPIAHAGVHPILTVGRDTSTVVGQIALWADFMPATGGLRPSSLSAHDPENDIATRPVHRLAGATPMVGAEGYTDLTCYLAARDERTTRAYVEDDSFDPVAGMTALVQDGAAAWIQHTGDLVVAGEAEHTGPLQARLRELADRWIEAGKPAATGWSTVFAPHPDLAAPLLTPSRWRHSDLRT